MHAESKIVFVNCIKMISFKDEAGFQQLDVDCIQPIVCPMAALFNMILLSIMLFQILKAKKWLGLRSQKFWMLTSMMVLCLSEFIKNGLDTSFHNIMVILSRCLLDFCTFFSIYFLFKKATKGANFVEGKKLNLLFLVCSQVINSVMSVQWLVRYLINKTIFKCPNLLNQEYPSLCLHQELCSNEVFLIMACLELACIIIFAIFVAKIIKRMRDQIQQEGAQ